MGLILHADGTVRQAVPRGPIRRGTAEKLHPDDEAKARAVRAGRLGSVGPGGVPLSGEGGERGEYPSTQRQAERLLWRVQRAEEVLEGNKGQSRMLERVQRVERVDMVLREERPAVQCLSGEETTWP